MKKVININFQGRVVPIEETAFEMLQNYTDSLRRFFANEEGKDEIINDIEGRIAELFAEILKKGNSCITDADVEAIIQSMGRPEDFETEEASVHSQLGANTSNGEQQQQQQFAQGRRLYRNANDKILAGVCGGLANYLNVDPILVRIIFVVLFSIAFIPYIVIWALVPSEADMQVGATRKRLFRDEDNKFISGVCAGLASYFNVNVWVPRLIFLIPFISFAFRWNHWDMFSFPNFFSISFSPGATLIYIILWIVLPVAKTTSEKLEMRGEKVDVNSIKNTVTEDLKGFPNRIAQQASKSGSSLGRIIAIIAKVFLYFIMASVLLSVVAAFAGFGIAGLGLLPLSDLILKDGWQSWLAIIGLVLFFWVPVVGIITWGIRRLTGRKGSKGILAYAFSALWIGGWIAMILLVASLSKDFRRTNARSFEQVALSNARVDKLEIRNSDYNDTFFYNSHRFRFEPFESINFDSIYVPNIDIIIEKSNSDSFTVRYARQANGSSVQEAERLAQFAFNIQQKDTILTVDKGIHINSTDKFRNQRVTMIVSVPVGKKIMVHEDVNVYDDVTIQFGPNHYNDEFWRYNRYRVEWSTGVEYIMTTEGLKRVDGKKSNNDSNADESLEEYKKSREKLEQELLEKKRELEQMERELKQVPDTTNRYKYKQVVVNPPKASEKIMATRLEKSDDYIPYPTAFILMRLGC